MGTTGIIVNKTLDQKSLHLSLSNVNSYVCFFYKFKSNLVYFSNIVAQCVPVIDHTSLFQYFPSLGVVGL